MQQINDAFNENLLDQFTLEPSRSASHCFSGRISGNNKDYIFVEIDKKHIGYFSILPLGIYQIKFHVNRLPYQVQHLALDFVKKHSLVRRFINNPVYKISEELASPKQPTRCSIPNVTR